MKQAFKALLEKWACMHQWKVHNSATIYGHLDDPENDLPIRRKETLICEKCGKIKKITLT